MSPTSLIPTDAAPLLAGPALLARPEAAPASKHRPLLDLTRFTGLAKGELPFWLTLGVLAVAGLVLARHLHDRTSLHPTAVFLLVALCCFCVGGFVGFLFGIPQTAAATPPDAGQARPSTNLEQISDWLTKIIIGMGLVELADLEDHLATLGKLVGRATGTPMVVPQLLVVVFAVLGFLASYIWTRIYYDGIQVRADDHLDKLEELAQRTAAVEQRTQQLAVETATAQALALGSNQDNPDAAPTVPTPQPADTAPAAPSPAAPAV